MKINTKKILSLIICLFLAISLVACDNGSDNTQADNSQNLNDTDLSYTELYISNEKAPINDNFEGINGVHMGWSFMPDTYEVNRTPVETELREIEYDRIAKTMGVKMVRTLYTSAFAYDEENKKWVWDTKENAVLGGFYDSLRALQDRGVEVGMSAMWALGFLDNSVSNTGNPISDFGGHGLYVANDLEATLKNYRQFMKDTVLSLEANGIHNVKYLFAYTECNNTYLSNNRKKNPNSTHFENRDYDKVCELFNKGITALDAGLKDAGKRDLYKIVGPCDNYRLDFDYSDSEQYSTMVKYTLENLSDKVDIIGSHAGYSACDDYSSDGFYYNPSITMGKTKEMVEKAGKEFWIDEYNAKSNEMDKNNVDENRLLNDSPMKGVALGATVNGIMNMGADNVFLWALADIQWPNRTYSTEFQFGMQIFGFLRSPLESMTPYNAYYSASLLTKYIGAGKVYECNEEYGLFISCIEREDGQWTVVVTNYNFEEVPIHINFAKALGRKNFYRHLYDSGNLNPTPDAGIIGVSAVANRVTNGFYDTLPPYSVAVYTTVKD